MLWFEVMKSYDVSGIKCKPFNGVKIQEHILKFDFSTDYMTEYNMTCLRAYAFKLSCLRCDVFA